MSKELEALNRLIEGLEDEHLGLSESEWVVESQQIIEKALKALEIIKKKELMWIIYSIAKKQTITILCMMMNIYGND